MKPHLAPSGNPKATRSDYIETDRRPASREEAFYLDPEQHRTR
jgi:hypothetical protein